MTGIICSSQTSGWSRSASKMASRHSSPTVDPDFLQDDLDVLADEGPVDLALRRNDKPGHLLGLLRCQQKGLAGLQHELDQRVGHGAHDDHLFLAGAEDVVVDARAVDNGSSGPADVRGLVHEGRRIAGAGTDGFFARAKDDLDDRPAACRHQHVDLRVLDELSGGGRGRASKRRKSNRADLPLARWPVKDADGLGTGFPCRGVRVENDGVAGRHHADRVVDQRAGGVGDRSQRADDPARRVFTRVSPWSPL